MNKKELQKLQNHFDNGSKDGFQVNRRYAVNDRIHLKDSICNGIITNVVFKEDRAYPYLKIKKAEQFLNSEVEKWHSNHSM